MSCSAGFDYTVKYSRRRSLCVGIADDNSLVVRCPYGTPRSEIERFLEAKRGWIVSNMSKNAAVMAEFSEILAYKKVLVGGEAYVLTLGGADKIENGRVCAKSFASLKRLIVGKCGEAFLSDFSVLAAEKGFHFSSVAFRSYSGRWGCCDGRGCITFNYKLLMLPERLRRLVMLHELCHTVVHDHSPAFRALLASVCPQRRSLERELKKYAFVARLYRTSKNA